MLVAILAFVAQSTTVIVSQAFAATGLMPDPAVSLAGDVHYHDNLARHIHAHHHGDAGHVHDTDDDHSEQNSVPAPFMTLGAGVAVIPVGAVYLLTSYSLGLELRHLTARLTGIRPDGPLRPPSTPSIA